MNDREREGEWQCPAGNSCRPTRAESETCCKSANRPTSKLMASRRSLVFESIIPAIESWKFEKKSPRLSKVSLCTPATSEISRQDRNPARKRNCDPAWVKIGGIGSLTRPYTRGSKSGQNPKSVQAPLLGWPDVNRLSTGNQNDLISARAIVLFKSAWKQHRTAAT